jgi:hypothetical protein
MCIFLSHVLLAEMVDDAFQPLKNPEVFIPLSSLSNKYFQPHFSVDLQHLNRLWTTSKPMPISSQLPWPPSPDRLWFFSSLDYNQTTGII